VSAEYGLRLKHNDVERVSFMVLRLHRRKADLIRFGLRLLYVILIYLHDEYSVWLKCRMLGRLLES